MSEQAQEVSEEVKQEEPQIVLHDTPDFLINKEPVQEAVQEPAQEEPTVEENPAATEEVKEEVKSEQPTESTTEEPAKKAEVVIQDSDLLAYLNKQLGKEFNSVSELNEAMTVKPAEVDERVAAIDKFVKETGRPPEDWYRYQSLDPSEMDDMSLIRLQMMADNPSLTHEEASILMSSKYKLDETEHDEDVVRLSKLQAKMDAGKAREVISKLRDSYKSIVPSDKPEATQSPYDEQWVEKMSTMTNDFGHLEFDLPEGETFKFGVDDNYRNQLIQKNKNIDSYFDQYKNQDGSWDYDRWNAHQTLVENISVIASELYKQGKADGLKGAVTQAANAESKNPKKAMDEGSGNSVIEQIRAAMPQKNLVTFKT